MSLSCVRLHKNVDISPFLTNCINPMTTRKTTTTITHIKIRVIDHAYWLDIKRKYNVELEIYSPYNSDHDGLCITIAEK